MANEVRGSPDVVVVGGPHLLQFIQAGLVLTTEHHAGVVAYRQLAGD